MENKIASMPLHNRLGAVVALVAPALLGSLSLAWPVHDVMLAGRSFPLSGRSLVGCIAIALAYTGTDGLVRSHPKVQPEQLRRSFLHCILPTAVTTVAWVLLARLPGFTDRAVGVAACAGALALLIAAEYCAVNPAGHWRTVAQLATYLVAALLYGTSYPALLDVNAARAGAVVSSILALRLLGEDDLPFVPILGASLGVGLLIGAVSWLLHPRIANPSTYSLTLVVFLYVLAGVARQLLWGKLRREVVLEYALVGLAALVLLFFYAQ